MRGVGKDVTPRLGLYRSPPRPRRTAGGTEAELGLYLALLSGGRFVRVQAPVEGFDFGGYVEEVLGQGDPEYGPVRFVEGQHFHHFGEFKVNSGRVHFSVRLLVRGEIFVPRWWVDVATEQFLVGRGEVYRWYKRVLCAAARTTQSECPYPEVRGRSIDRDQ